jgi:hypothetical protein
MAMYNKYICTELKKRHMLPGPTPEERDMLASEGLRISMEHVLWIDDEIIPGAYYGETTWIWPASYPNQISWADAMKRSSNNKPMFPHVHDFPELLSWWGTDAEHPDNTNSMKILLGDEEIPLENSWLAYIPAGMKHMPSRNPDIKVATVPVCHWTSGPGEYTREKNNKKSHEQLNQKDEESVIKKTGKFNNSKYIIFANQQKPKKPAFMSNYDPKNVRHMAHIDQEVIHDAEFGCEAFWLMPGDKSKSGQIIIDTHTFPHGTSIVLNTMNYDNITDLCAEVEFSIGGEKQIINKSFGAYIPPNVEQGPMIIRNITKQILFVISYPIGEGIKKYRGR